MGRHTCSAGEQFTDDDLYRIEPVQRPRLAAGSYLVPVAFAEIPQADLVEIMQSQGTSYTVDDHGVGYRLGYYVGKIQFQEPDAADDAAARDVTDLDQYDEYQTDEEAEGGEESKDEAGACRALDDRL